MIRRGCGWWDCWKLVVGANHFKVQSLKSSDSELSLKYINIEVNQCDNIECGQKLCALCMRRVS